MEALQKPWYCCLAGLPRHLNSRSGLPHGYLHLSSYLCFISAISVRASRIIFFVHFQSLFKDNWQNQQAGCDFTAVEGRQL